MTNPKKQPNKWLGLINIPFQMGITIYIFHFIGSWLDEHYTSQFYTDIFTLLGVFLAIYFVIRQISQLNHHDE